MLWSYGVRNDSGSWQFKFRDFVYAIWEADDLRCGVQDRQHPPRIPSTRAERLIGPLSVAPVNARTERDSIENKFKKAGCVNPVESGKLSTFRARLHNGIMIIIEAASRRT